MCFPVLRHLHIPVADQPPLARPAHRPRAAADAAGDDRARPHQLQPADQHLLRLPHLRRGPGGDREGVPHLHAAPGHVQRRRGDRAVPGAQPARHARGLGGPASHPGQRDAPDRAAADPRRGGDDRAAGADHAPRLRARGVRRAVDRPGRRGALLVLLLAPLQRLQPAAHANLLQPPAAVDADGAGRRHAGDQHRGVGRPLRAARDRRRRPRIRGVDRGDDGRPGVLPAPADRRAPARHDAARHRAHPRRRRGARRRRLRHLVRCSTTRSGPACSRRSSRSARRSRSARPSTPRSCSPCGSPRRARSSSCSRAGCAAR